MFESLLIWLQSIATAWGVWGVFFLAFLQEIIPPIPSTLVSVGSGLLIIGDAPISVVSVTKLITHVSFPLAAGMTIGATIVYGLVYWGGAPLVRRFGHLVGISWDDIEHFKSRMSGTYTDEAILFFARAFPLTPSILINVVCGMLRWNPFSFILSTFFGTLIRATISGFVGWQLGAALITYSSFIERAHNTIFVLFILATAAFFGYRRYKAKKEGEKKEPIEA